MFAKWPLTDIMEGAVGCRKLVEGRRGEDREAMTQRRLQVQATRLKYINNKDFILVMWRPEISSSRVKGV